MPSRDLPLAHVPPGPCVDWTGRLHLAAAASVAALLFLCAFATMASP